VAGALVGRFVTGIAPGVCGGSPVPRPAGQH